MSKQTLFCAFGVVLSFPLLYAGVTVPSMVAASYVGMAVLAAGMGLPLFLRLKGLFKNTQTKKEQTK